MKEFKGTPGEWFVSDDTSEINKKISEKGYHFISTESGYYSDEYDSGFEISGCISIHDAKLIAAAPDFLQAALMGQTMQTKEFLHWIADRLVFVHGENENVDFIISLRERADAIGKAVEKALGE